MTIRRQVEERNGLRITTTIITESRLDFNASDDFESSPASWFYRTIEPIEEPHAKKTS